MENTTFAETRALPVESVEGEIGLVIDYTPGKSEAITVLSAAMRLIEALDKLDHCLLSSIDTALEPVSILNDVQHSSLKILLARALRKIPDDALGNMDWEKWLGGLLVKGKHRLLTRIDADDASLASALTELQPDYLAAPNATVGYFPPSVADAREALRQVSVARALIPDGRVVVQTEIGDVIIPHTPAHGASAAPQEESLSDNVLMNQVLIIESAVFKEGNQWRFSDGSASFSAAIADETFLRRIEEGERFGKGGHLVVDLRIEQMRTDVKISTRREIVLVKQHKDRHLQLVLPTL